MSDAIPLTGFELAFDPAAASLPSSLTLLTDAGALAVKLPASAPSGRVAVELARPITSKCVGLVLDRPAAPAGKKPAASSSAFGLAEVAARTSLDAESLEQVAKGLGASGPELKLREALLLAERARGVLAIAKVYAELPPAARERARRVVDLAPCDQRLKVFIPLLEGADKDESDRARDRIRACNKEAGPPLLAAIAETKSLEQRGAIAEEAALLAPATAIPPLLEWLQKAERPDERQAFRKALAKGALREVGLRTLDATIAAETFAALPLITRIDVLRALGPEIGRTQHGAAAFGAVAKAAVDFRDRYLLLSVAADLARAGDAGALGVLTAALADDADPRLVARAASLSRGVTKLTPRLFALLDAKHVRVREAALLALTSPGAPVGAALGNKLLGRLTEDPWTFVRLAAAGALVAAPKDAALDAKIAAAVDLEPSPGVRAELSRTLGERDARSASQTLRERAFDRKEAIEVRVAALGALGQVCDKSASEELSAMALQGVRPTFESDRKLAVAAISALAVLRPASLKDTLTKLAAKDAPPELRAAAKRELERTAAPCK